MLLSNLNEAKDNQPTTCTDPWTCTSPCVFCRPNPTLYEVFSTFQNSQRNQEVPAMEVYQHLPLARALLGVWHGDKDKDSLLDTLHTVTCRKDGMMPRQKLAKTFALGMDIEQKIGLDG
ncbi:hypothetical protein AV530_005910 [Patagioenas fasciata monilis]|uniref:Uncharacterized protein n=1 Tax=Patagioenas fasciata monilis TaxID=372326 RepID=A0A1V4JNG5_PATFA|nr:hypothetical protein AV530_005910 [Patagioenas fasciata monilis]